MTKQQLKILAVVYAATDRSNEVYDYATLHHTQRPIAEAMPDLVVWIDGCVPVDGDGFSQQTYTEGRGYRLTTAGYEALTAHNAECWPIDRRRFWTPRNTCTCNRNHVDDDEHAPDCGTPSDPPAQQESPQ